LEATLKEKQWEIHSEFSVPSLKHNELKVVDGVMKVINGLGISQEKASNLVTAVSEAAMNAIEHGNMNDPELDVDVQVWVNRRVIGISISDQGAGGRIMELEEPDLSEKLEFRQSPRGWGFYLIKNMIDRMELRYSGGRNTIDLYMYRD